MGDEAGVLEDAKVLRDGRAADREAGCQIADRSWP
jgi:hypothetical protein